MKRKLLTLAIAGAALGAMLAPAAVFAASDNALAPGVPGDPNCVGQTMSYLAQLVKNAGAEEVADPGIGGIVELAILGATNQELKAVVVAYCNPPA